MAVGEYTAASRRAEAILLGLERCGFPILALEDPGCVVGRSVPN